MQIKKIAVVLCDASEDGTELLLKLALQTVDPLSAAPPLTQYYANGLTPFAFDPTACAWLENKPCTDGDNNTKGLQSMQPERIMRCLTPQWSTGFDNALSEVLQYD